MGWYRLSNKFQSTYEFKIVKSDIENIARRKLFYKGNSSPTNSYLNQIISNVLDNLVKKYGTIDKIRLSSSGDDLSYIIEKAVEEELP
jgi:hypothetical protein